MGDEERARILRMVAEGKISPEEAADLLEAVESTESAAAEAPSDGPIPPMRPVPAVSPGRLNRRPRVLVIHVRDGGENKVNVRIPLGLTRQAGKFIPRQAQAYLGKYDINLQEFLEQLVDADAGTLLEVKDGESKVLIAVE